MSEVLNHDVDWDTFNGETYRRKYFDPLSDEDAWVGSQIVCAYDAFREPGEMFDEGMDAGCGPSLVPAIAGSPYVNRLSLLEPGSQNVHYMDEVLRDRRRLEREWATTFELVRSHPNSVPQHRHAASLVMSRAVVIQGEIQDIADESVDAFTSVFFAESATEDTEEAAELVDHTLRVTKKGGLFVSAYIEHSEGWPDHEPLDDEGTIVPRKFPAADISMPWLKERFRGTGIHVRRCEYEPALRKGYTGILLAAGRK